MSRERSEHDFDRKKFLAHGWREDSKIPIDPRKDVEECACVEVNLRRVDMACITIHRIYMVCIISSKVSEVWIFADFSATHVSISRD